MEDRKKLTNQTNACILEINYIELLPLTSKMSASIEKFGLAGLTALFLIFGSVLVNVSTDEHAIGSKLEAERVQRKKYDDYAFNRCI